MFGLRHLSRNVTRTPLIQYISTTSIKNDETDSKDPPPKKKDQKAKDSAPDKLSDAQVKLRKKLLGEQKDPISAKFDTVLKSKEAKNVRQKQSKARESLKMLFKGEKSPEIAPEKEIEKKHLDQNKELRNLFTESKPSESEPLIDEVNEIEDHEEKRKEHLKGKQKLEALMQEAETMEVEEKIKLTHPPEKRPVDKVLIKADTKAQLDLLKSIREVATEIGGDVKLTEKELMHAVFEATVSEESEKKRRAEPASSLEDVVSDMAVDLTQSKPQDRLRSLFEAQEQIQHRRKRFARIGEEDGEQTRTMLSHKLFNSEPLKIFDEEYSQEVLSKSKDQLALETYNEIQKKELKKLVTHTPKNIYEEMIKWTNEGKLWHFPIDNEWKWDWEANVEFTEHILLEQHLEPWCPTGGPIRHFMELVCVGLGKNPYITAEEKRRHIYWFRDYFEEKRKLLEEIGAFGSEQKKIEQTQ